MKTIPKIFGIFGYPIQHSLSPAMHNAAFQALGLPHLYLPFGVPPRRLKGAIEALGALGVSGINLTRPHKEAVIPFLDRLTDEAAAIGAVNTIEIKRGKRIGHNTDGVGFLRSLSEAKVDPAGMRVILLGAGGAARGVAVSLLMKPISELVIMARSETKGSLLARSLGALFPKRKISLVSFDQPKFGRGPTLLINSTPLGMKPDDPLPYPVERLHPKWIVSDLTYVPSQTALLRSAEAIGARTVPGIGMLLHQGAIAFEIWTRKKAPLHVMRLALEEALARKNG
jgi:shikimate dehydrogenase